MSGINWNHFNSEFDIDNPVAWNITAPNGIDRRTGLYLDVKTILDFPSTGSDVNNVAKFTAKFLDACRKAQENLNAANPDSPRVATYGNPTFSSPVNGFVTITRPTIVRAEIATAFNISALTS